jgi:hypothetical protein
MVQRSLQNNQDTYNSVEEKSITAIQDFPGHLAQINRHRCQRITFQHEP